MKEVKMQLIRIKHIVILTFTLFTLCNLSAQNNVGIGSVTPHPSVLLEVSDSSRGVLIPRTDTLAILEYVDGLNPSPGIANGLLIFDTLVNTYMYYEEVSGNWKNLLNLVGPRGARGNPGPRGPMGDTGMINDWRDSAGFDQKILVKDTCNDWFFDSETGQIWKVWCDTLGGTKPRKWIDTTLWDLPIGNLMAPDERILVFNVHYANATLFQSMANDTAIVDMIPVTGMTISINVDPDEIAYIWFAAHGTTSKFGTGKDMSYAQYDITVNGNPYFRSGNMQQIVTIGPNGPLPLEYADRVGWYLSGQTVFTGDITDPIDCRCGTPYQKPSCLCSYGPKNVIIALEAGNRYSGSSSSSVLFLADRVTSENPAHLSVFAIIRRNPAALPRKR